MAQPTHAPAFSRAGRHAIRLSSLFSEGGFAGVSACRASGNRPDLMRQSKLFDSSLRFLHLRVVCLIEKACSHRSLMHSPPSPERLFRRPHIRATASLKAICPTRVGCERRVRGPVAGRWSTGALRMRLIFSWGAQKRRRVAPGRPGLWAA